MAFKHIGFSGLTNKLEREGKSAESARKIAASVGHKASAEAKRKNPHLLRISGVKKPNLSKVK